MKTLSIVIPVYNERATIEGVVRAVHDASLPNLKKEIVIVDDGSTDGTREALRALERDKRCRVFFGDVNRGKGAAVRRGFREATGDFIIIQDADLEYDPKEFPIMLEPLLSGMADVVYGSRFMGAAPHRVLFFWHHVGNKFLTLLSNICTNLNLTDMETGYKAFSRAALHRILPHLTANRFGIEPELTALVARHRLRVYEVGISYAGRTYAEGKKIRWGDGVAAIWFIIKYNFFR